LSVQIRTANLIPNLRPQNFTVYENGARRPDVTAEVVHAPITLAVLIEGGGRYQAINKILGTEVSYLVRPLADALVPGDKVGTFAYADSVRTLPISLRRPDARLGRDRHPGSRLSGDQPVRRADHHARSHATG